MGKLGVLHSTKGWVSHHAVLTAANLLLSSNPWFAAYVYVMNSSSMGDDFPTSGNMWVN